jgi:hypothetical protein
MSRYYRITLLVATTLALLNAAALVVGASPCMPGDIGCPGS